MAFKQATTCKVARPWLQGINEQACNLHKSWKKKCLHLGYFSFQVSTKIIWKKKIEPLDVVAICVWILKAKLHMHEQDDKLQLQSYK